MRTIKILIFCCATLFSYAQEKKLFPKLSVAENKTLVELFPTTEQAQKFASEMNSTKGVAKIENVAIENGNLKLEKVANTLAFEKVVVSKETQIDFMATNAIDLTETTMMPNIEGNVSLLLKGFENEETTNKVISNEESVSKVYPNPTNASINISLNSSYKNEATVFVYDVKGNLIFQQEISKPIESINIASWSSGSYWFNIKGNISEEMFTVIKE
jgi:hypothetical protein